MTPANRRFLLQRTVVDGLCGVPSPCSALRCSFIVLPHSGGRAVAMD